MYAHTPEEVFRELATYHHLWSFAAGRERQLEEVLRAENFSGAAIRPSVVDELRRMSTPSSESEIAFSVAKWWFNRSRGIGLTLPFAAFRDSYSELQKSSAPNRQFNSDLFEELNSTWEKAEHAGGADAAPGPRR